MSDKDFIFIMMLVIAATAAVTTILISAAREKYRHDKKMKYNEGYEKGYEKARKQCEDFHKRSVNSLANNRIRDYLSGYRIQDVVLIPPKAEKNPGLTVVKWGDGSETTIRCLETDAYDPEKAIAFCVMKKMYGNKFKSAIKKYTEGLSNTDKDSVE